MLSWKHKATPPPGQEDRGVGSPLWVSTQVCLADKGCEERGLCSATWVGSHLNSRASSLFVLQGCRVVDKGSKGQWESSSLLGTLQAVDNGRA